MVECITLKTPDQSLRDNHRCCLATQIADASLLLFGPCSQAHYGQQEANKCCHQAAPRTRARAWRPI